MFLCSQGSVGVNYAVVFNETTPGLTEQNIKSQVEQKLNRTDNGTFLGPLQLQPTANGDFLTFSGTNNHNVLYQILDPQGCKSKPNYM